MFLATDGKIGGLFHLHDLVVGLLKTFIVLPPAHLNRINGGFELILDCSKPGQVPNLVKTAEFNRTFEMLRADIYHFETLREESLRISRIQRFVF